MSARVLWTLMATALVPLAACDVSQSKPETFTRANGTDSAVTPYHLPIPAVPGMQAPNDAQSGIQDLAPASGERSLRLYGPGVSRDRQVRV